MGFKKLELKGWEKNEESKRWKEREQRRKLRKGIRLQRERRHVHIYHVYRDTCGELKFWYL